MAIEVRPLAAALGAEVIGADLARYDDDSQFARIHEALLRYGVLAVRDQHITPTQHISFSRRFGDLEIHVLEQYLLPGHPEILLISNKEVDGRPIGLRDAGNEWHTDLSYKECPALGSLLYALEIPDSGGDTLFASLTAAYEGLSTDLRTRLATLRARHTYAQYHERSQGKGRGTRQALSEAQKAKVPMVSHPLIRRHPETGRHALYISPGLMVGVEGMDDGAGRALLDELHAHATQEAFVYRHRWRVHDVLFWDNRCTMHLATAYDPAQTRHMHRTTIIGDPPV